VSARHRVVWTEAAASDYESILVYVATRGGLLSARSLNEKLQGSIESLSASPTRCRIVPELRAEGLPMYRELIVRPYRVMFRIHDREVVLLAVMDGRRDLAELLLERALAY
jgi:toxin ParE1/3/4